jgi:hypothetical protein
MSDYAVVDYDESAEATRYRQQRDRQTRRYEKLKRQGRCICCTKINSSPYVRCAKCHKRFRADRAKGGQ